MESSATHVYHEELAKAAVGIGNDKLPFRQYRQRDCKAEFLRLELRTPVEPLLRLAELCQQLPVSVKLIDCGNQRFVSGNRTAADIHMTFGIDSDPTNGNRACGYEIFCEGVGYDV